MNRTPVTTPLIGLTALRTALATLDEAGEFWAAPPDGSPLKRHWRSAVVQSFEFTYELSLRRLRRVLIERAETADLVADLSFNDVLRKAADAAARSAGGQPWEPVNRHRSKRFPSP